MKIYTRTGDSGDTRLFDGTRVRKADPRVEAYGSVDELNSFIGAAAAFLEGPELRDSLAQIQIDLFSVGAQLADPRSRDRADSRFHLPDERVAALENDIDRLETELPPLRQFIIAGGTPAGALLHVARTVCRRAEREVVLLTGSVEIDPSIIKYLNRLSDYLFVAARWVNRKAGREEVPW